jgi:DNA-binding transcriptional LysR family regulator
VGHEYDIFPRPIDPLFERGELMADPVLLAVPAAGPLAGNAHAGRPVRLDALAGQPFLAPRSSTSCAEMIQRACARAGFMPRVVARASDFHVLLSLVGAGAGITLVPRLAARNSPAGVRLVEPAEPVTRRIFTVSRRGGERKPAVRVILDALAAEATGFTQPATTAA